MLETIQDEIELRLNTVPGLTVFTTEMKQIKDSDIPSAIIHLESQSPTGTDWKHGSRYKVSLDISIEVFHSSLSGLYQLIESVENSLQINLPIPGTFGWNYSRLAT